MHGVGRGFVRSATQGHSHSDAGASPTIILVVVQVNWGRRVAVTPRKGGTRSCIRGGGCIHSRFLVERRSAAAALFPVHTCPVRSTSIRGSVESDNTRQAPGPHQSSSTAKRCERKEERGNLTLELGQGRAPAGWQAGRAGRSHGFGGRLQDERRTAGLTARRLQLLAWCWSPVAAGPSRPIFACPVRSAG